MNYKFQLPEDNSDLLLMEHVTVAGHTRMSNLQRAAQFAPFAALSTHEPEAESEDAE